MNYSAEATQLLNEQTVDKYSLCLQIGDGLLCQICQATLPDMQSLNAHYDTAHPTGTGNAADSKNFVCDLCEKSYVAKEGLVKHMKFTHSVDIGQHKIACEACGQMFTTVGNLKRHTARAHGKEAAERLNGGRSGGKPTKERKFVCDVCGQRFTEKSNLTRHLRKAH